MLINSKAKLNSLQPKLRGRIHANALLLLVSPTSHSSSTTYTTHAILQHKSFSTPCTSTTNDTQQHKPKAAVHTSLPTKLTTTASCRRPHDTPRCNHALPPAPHLAAPHSVPTSTISWKPRRLVARIVNYVITSTRLPLPRTSHARAIGQHCRAYPTTQPRIASSTTPCSSSLRPHLHNVVEATPPRRTHRELRHRLNTTAASPHEPRPRHRPALSCLPCPDPTSPHASTC
jgi:hypothetical protein